MIAAIVLQPSLSRRLVEVRLPQTTVPAGQEVVQTVEDLSPGIAFDEAIPSWNVVGSERVVIEARTKRDGRPTKWYVLARWTPGPDRETVDGQKDADGNVLTDTLRFAKAATTLDLRVTVKAGVQDATVKLITVSFANKTDRPSAAPPLAWGKTLTVPEKAQGNYPRGNVICSPTSLTMVLNHWGKVENRPDLLMDVPEVVDAVWDRVYKGSGNWPFNTAYAGTFPGLKAYVARFDSLNDLERWIDAGIPVICSIAFSLTQGKPLDPNEQGHLVVLIGFTKEGDPIFNDPARRDQVRYIYKRANFDRGWANSRRTVYLVYPESAPIPEPTSGLWLPRKS